MRYRELGKTGLRVSEIGFGGEWLERHDEDHSVELLRYAHDKGINIVDCWMPDPKSRTIIGKAMEGCRDSWFVQGHVGSTWQNGQYVRTDDDLAIKAGEICVAINQSGESTAKLDADRILAGRKRTETRPGGECCGEAVPGQDSPSVHIG